MSNLGEYQAIVVAAARAGGVSNLIGEIESGAVAKAAPRLVGKGAGAGALVTLGAVGVAVVGKRVLDTYKARKEAGDQAKVQLREMLEEPATQEEPDSGDAEGPHDPHIQD